MVTKLGYNTSIFEGARALIESHHVGVDLIMCILGRRISDGNFRAVYEHALDPTKVIKIEYGFSRKDTHDCIMQNSFCNIQEFLLWREIEGLTGKLKWVKNWFAPIEWISPSGHIMCMEKTEQLPDRKRPGKIPEFLWDVKQENFGWIGDKFVCHDYAHVSALITYEKKFQKVKDYWN
ncbi:hypothetical protein DYBT9275_02760 [Dyadobacter sp. CECT 9275]|uniref:Uncharacterized protein n=1 Tax=Dyadobacter helix TaxID=2822344 RepID=A0A916JD81_9BACT|nr:hypothetical protein [Dyadobacter sp. CECT 9275]CAG5001882.1 hypothetical protein DYBT9275_02760 [Dyadobacter sp. CECT 9275]